MNRRKIGKILIWLVAILLVLFTLCYVLLRIPAIQTLVVKKLASTLSAQLGTTVSLDRVNIKFFRTASLDNVYLADESGDTLLYAENIDASIKLFRLFGRRLEFDQIATEGLKLYLDRKTDDASFNYQFIIDHFTADTLSTASPWQFKLNKIKISHAVLKVDDNYLGQQIQGNLGSFSIYLDDLDNINKSIRISQIGLGDSRFSIISSQPATTDTILTESGEIRFPYSGWNISIMQVRLEENDLSYRNLSVPQTDALNPSDLQLSDVNMFLDNFIWTSSSLVGDLSKFSTKDKSGFILEDLSAKISLSEKEFTINDLEVSTPNSHLSNQTSFSFSSFSQFSTFPDSVIIYSQFSDSEIDFKDLKVFTQGFREIPYLNSDLDEKISLHGRLRGSLNDLKLDKMNLAAGNLLKISLDGGIKNLMAPAPLYINLDLHKLATSYEALLKLTRDANLPKGLANWNDFLLSGKVKGNLRNIQGRQVKLTTSSVTRFEGDFKIQGLPDINKTIFDVDVVDLRSIASDLQGFSESKLPPALDSLGQFFYAGKYRGTIYDFILDGTLSSDAGSMKTDLKITFEKDYKNASYSGDLTLNAFDLGKVLARDDLETLSMDINIFGSGFQPDVLRATVLGEVQDLVYNGYHYRDLIIDGRFDKKQFAGHASVDDPNISFDFEGVINLSDSLSRFRFNANVDTINFSQLGFISQQLGLKGKIEADFRGKDADSMKGSIVATKLAFSNLNEHFILDSLLIYSDYSHQDVRSLEVRSDLVNGQIEGKFSLQELPVFFRGYFNQYFPLDVADILSDTMVINSRDSAAWSLRADQDFSFDWTFTNLHQVIGLVDPKFELLDTVIIGGRVDGENDLLGLNGYAHQIKYNGMSFGPITLTSAGDESTLDHVIAVNNAHIANGIDFPFLNVDLSMTNDSAYLGIIMEDASDTIQEKFNLAAVISESNGTYSVDLNQVMVLNGLDWQINPKHKITYRKGDVKINDLSISRDSQQILVSTDETTLDGVVNSSYNLRFDKFHLSEISQLLEVQDAIYAGELDGTLTIRENGSKMNYLADLVVNQLTLKNEPIGNLIVKSEQRSDELLDIMVRLEGGISGLDIRGTYNKTNSAIDFQGELDQLDVATLDPFFRKYFTESTGKLSGTVKVNGTTLVPVLDGSFELEKISTLIQYLQARYTFANEEIRIEQNKMNLTDFNLVDQSGNKAVLNGYLDFKNLADPDLSLSFNTDRFLVLNTPPDAKEFFYGKLFVGGDVTVRGSLAQPILEVNATAQDSTDFVLQPLLSEASIQQEDFIIYANPEDYRSDTTMSLQDLYKVNGFNIDLTVNLICNPEAQLTIVVDPATGDKLVCRGNGNLVISITPDGDANIRGTYLITQGQYAFNFQRVIKRTFDIDAGSQVTFTGDILQTRFDISASYGVKTSTYELIKNQSTLSGTEEVKSRQRSDVQVKLKLTGNLERPIAKFDIGISENSGAGVASSVSTKLAQLREDETAMNKQVFGLLIFNSFITEEQTTNSGLLADAGQSAILSSVSNLLSNELNRLAKRYIKGVDLDFGVDSYSNTFDDGNSLITELKVGLSKRLLNDRLTVKLGGNLQFENSNVEVVNNQNSTFSGDFILEYKLSPEGNYNLRFFQVLSNGENIFSPGVNYSETGVSIFFTKSFNSKKYQLQLNEQ